MKLRRFGLLANLALGGLLMLAVWVLLVWVASRPALKTLIDLTPQRVNSVDPVTEELLRDLRRQEAEVELHLFLQAFDGEVADDAARQGLEIRSRLVDVTRLLLKRYEALGGPSVTLREHSPYGDTAGYREAAQAFGYTAADNEALVVAVRMPGKERRFRKLSLVSDLAVIDLPPRQQQGPIQRAPVPVLKDYRGEQAISSALKGLLVQGNPVLYLLEGYSTGVDFGTTSALGYGVLLGTLAQTGFDVRTLNLRETGTVPADAAMVLVIEPKSEIAPRDADVLYEYVRRGGRLFVNYSWSPIPDFNPTGGRLGELLGYELSTQPVFHRIPDVQGRTGGRSIDGDDAVARLGLQVNRLHPTTRRLAESGRPFELVWARELRERAGAPANVRREPLLLTGDEGWLAVPDQNGQPDNRAPQIRLRSFVVGMACELDAAADDEGGSSDRPRTGQAVVVSGVFCNNAAMPYFGDFALNVCNWMADRRVLLDIQGARYEARSLQVQPQQLDRVWSLLVVWVPNAFLALGLVVLWLRRR